MILRAESRVAEPSPNCCGGAGVVAVTDILGEAQMKGQPTLWAHARIEPGSSIGYHVHQGESEIYLILKGQARFSDNGEEVLVGPMDVTITSSGEGHAIEPVDAEGLDLLALIVRSDGQ